MTTHVTGLEVKTYRNTGTAAVPVWDELARVIDETLDFEKAAAEIKNRESGNKREKGTTKFWSGSFGFHEIKNAADTDFDALWDSWLNGTVIEIAVMDGDIATSDNKGFRIGMEVMNMSQKRNLEDANEWEVSYSLTEFFEAAALVEPSRYTVP